MNTHRFTFLGLGILTSILFIGSFPAWNFPILAWITLMPLTLVLMEEKPVRSALIACLAGAFAMGGIYYWVFAGARMGNISPIRALGNCMLLSLYDGLYWAAWGSSVGTFWRRQKRHHPSSFFWTCLAFPGFSAAGWMLMEIIRANMGLQFPWANLGSSQAPKQIVLQIASLVGVNGLSGIIVFVNFGLAAALRERWVNKSTPQIFIKHLLPPLVALILVLTFGMARLAAWREAVDRPISVAILQGNIAHAQKWSPGRREMIESRYQSLVLTAASRHVELMVYPETAIVRRMTIDQPVPLLQKLAKTANAEEIIGVPLAHKPHSYNGALSVDKIGNIVSTYAKHRLLPFGEFIPRIWLPRGIIGEPHDLGGHFDAGTDLYTLKLASATAGMSICFEAIFPQAARDAVLQGADFLVNLSNDSWFMDTAELEQHLAASLIRSVETDRWMLRADNQGISAIINPVGQITIKSKVSETALVLGTFVPRHTKTLFVLYGGLIPWLCFGLCSLLWLACRWTLP